MIIGLSTFKAKKKKQSIVLLHDFHENVGFIPPCNYQITLLNNFIQNLSAQQKDTHFYVEIMPHFNDWIQKNRAHVHVTTTLTAILAAVDSHMQKGSVRFINFDNRSAIDFAMLTISSFCEQLRAHVRANKLSLKRLFYGGDTFSEAVDAYCSRAKINNEWLPVMYQATVGGYLDQIEKRLIYLDSLINAMPISDALKEMIKKHYQEIYTVVHADISQILTDKKVDPDTHLFYAAAILQDQYNKPKVEAQFITEAAFFADIELLSHILHDNSEQIIVHAGAIHTGFVAKMLLLLQEEYESTSTFEGYIVQGLMAVLMHRIMPQWMRYKLGLLKPYFVKKPHLMKKRDLFAVPLSTTLLQNLFDRLANI